MTDDPYISLLPAIRWLEDAVLPLSPAEKDWLFEQGSMTRRLEQHCLSFSVRRGREGFFPAAESGEEIALLPDSEQYWLREVVLCGDEQPWLAGRTLIPADAVTGSECALTTLGDMPLGRWLFRDGLPARDFIQLGRAGELWARRSRLRTNGKPLLLTELFLPGAPLYR